eukprot:CAMPEP_0115176968 /NCGR_PEP_ID=MMETSP0270-20121206/5140_1 /TAXON_ID=71861 /ORGANISM="Scrippsiella trochoidea, Strain CCMP3099" /LENGTH=128 /DNA_ID=CAMNT_0002589879 /DNA_START=961 /DNA_END=1344 /DNA_ORIENTATION=+
MNLDRNLWHNHFNLRVINMGNMHELSEGIDESLCAKVLRQQHAVPLLRPRGPDAEEGVLRRVHDAHGERAGDECRHGGLVPREVAVVGLDPQRLPPADNEQPIEGRIAPRSVRGTERSTTRRRLTRQR